MPLDMLPSIMLVSERWEDLIRAILNDLNMIDVKVFTIAHQMMPHLCERIMDMVINGVR